MESEIKRLLSVQKQTGEHGRHCPDEIQLAAFVAKRLDRPAHAAVESHLADCDFCLSQLAFLIHPFEKFDQVPFSLLARARDIGARKPKATFNWGWRWAAPIAALACLVIFGVVVVLQLRNREANSPVGAQMIAQQTEPLPVTSPEVARPPQAVRSESAAQTHVPKPKSEGKGVVRRGSPEGGIPNLLAPVEGAVINRNDLELRWQTVPDAMFYEVRVLSTAGEIILVEQTERTSLKPGAVASLAPGTKYFVVVTAHLREGRTEKSEVVSFRVTGK